GTVLAPFLFTFYTADVSINSPGCHLKTFSDDSAIVCLIAGENSDTSFIQHNLFELSQRNLLRVHNEPPKPASAPMPGGIGGGLLPSQLSTHRATTRNHQTCSSYSESSDTSTHTSR
ncbi:hypothetical protein XENORESO_007970, partial [Xenotaenia resolanae]